MKNYFYTNPLKFKIVNDIKEAKKIWEYFSPHQEIDDEWDFRFAFYNYLKFPLHFIVGYDRDEPIGLLPLQYNAGKGPTPMSYEYKSNFLEFFGGDDMDSNKVFLKPGYEDLTSIFLLQVQNQAVLAPLASPYILQQTSTTIFTNKFIADLSQCIEFRDFLMQQFDGKGRGKLVNQLNKLQRNNKVTIEDANDDDLESLFAYNKTRFGEASSFQWEYRKQVFRDLMEQYSHDVFKVVINREIKAVSFSLLFNNMYLSMNIGYDYNIRDLGKFVVSTQIERAIKLKCKTYDAGKGDSGWKEQFHLQKIPQYMMTISAKDIAQYTYS